MGRKHSKADVQEALDALRDRIERATRDVDGSPMVYLILRHVARSGMQRVIWPFVVEASTGQPLGIGYCGAVAMGWRYDESREGIVVGGAGMDMGWHLVHCISVKLYGRTTDVGSTGRVLTSRWL